MKITRRKFLVGALAATAGVYVDMRYLEPRWLTVDEVDVKLPSNNPSSPVKVLHLSDLHVVESSHIDFIREAFELGLSHNPDVICLTGDFISRSITVRTEYIKALKLLSDRAPCYACAGNHDGGRWLAAHGGLSSIQPVSNLLSDANVSMLFNETASIKVKNATVNITGIGDIWSAHDDAQKAFAAISDSNDMSIVLSHNPDSKERLKKNSWDLMLCGHTHGGQLSLPVLGTPFAPVHDHGYIHGLNPWKDRLIYTTRGVGSLHKLRLNCRPEVSILNIS